MNQRLVIRLQCFNVWKAITFGVQVEFTEKRGRRWMKRDPMKHLLIDKPAFFVKDAYNTQVKRQCALMLTESKLFTGVV